jgi:hypothetical protein
MGVTLLCNQGVGVRIPQPAPNRHAKSNTYTRHTNIENFLATNFSYKEIIFALGIQRQVAPIICCRGSTQGESDDRRLRGLTIRTTRAGSVTD